MHCEHCHAVSGKLDALYRLIVELDRKAGQIMAAQDDINAAVTQQGVTITAIDNGVAALQAGEGGTPVDTTALVASTAALQTATSALVAATPAPAPAPADSTPAEPSAPATPFS